MVISKKTIIFQGFRGGPTFQHFPGGGVQLFSWGGEGVQMLYISKETHKIDDFSPWGGGPCPTADNVFISFLLVLNLF